MDATYSAVFRRAVRGRQTVLEAILGVDRAYASRFGPPVWEDPQFVGVMENGAWVALRAMRGKPYGVWRAA